MREIGVLGCGTMATGIVQVLAQNNYKVKMWARPLDEDMAKTSLKSLEKVLARLVEKERITEEDKNKTLDNISLTTKLEDLANSDLVIEAVLENMAIKKDLFSQLDHICSDTSILATNTSSLSITEIASSTTRPDKVIGMHFFNPAPIMKLVEVIRGISTCDDTKEKIVDLCKNINKVPVEVEEAPGFVVNRILVPMINEAVGILADGVASVEDIDEAMKLGANHPMGPLALGDLIGLDVCLNIMEVLYNEFGDSKYRPHPLLRKMVRGNLLGRKTKKGFYTY